MKAEQARWIHETMVRIREFETRVAKLFADGELPGFVHLYLGQEAVAAGVSAHLRDDDYVTSSHRGHGHCIAKGVDTGSMMAELYGHRDGTCHGKGGSMHIADGTKGMLGANGIVGAGPPLACGAALTAKLKGTDRVSVVFFGDGATAQGTMHEAMNLASIWKLPLLFVCENNRVSEATPLEYYSSVTTLADRAAAYDMPGVSVDGMDPFAVFEAAGEAIERARNGGGPTFLEANTWRYHGHFEGDQMGYRNKEEDEGFRKRDPIATFAAQVADKGLLTEDAIAEIAEHARTEIEEAVEFARSSQPPEPEACLADAYVSYPEAQIMAPA